MEYLTLYHHDSSVKTLAEYMEAEHIPTSVISVDELFDYNRDMIFNQMSLNEKAEYAKQKGKDSITSDDLTSDMTLPCPCTLKIQAKNVTYELAISQTNFEAQTDNIYAFENQQIQNILQNEGYNIDRSTKKLNPECSVWGWFKSLYYVGALDNMNALGTIRSNTNKFVDISDFIVNMTTNVSLSGGSFSITLPIINSIQQLLKIEPYADTNNSLMKIFTYTDRRAEQIDLYQYGKQFFHKGGIVAMEHNYFNWLIQSNDLLFISFEKLELEKSLGSNVFDMIGLVDNVSVYQDANGNGNVTVSGRDLMKLLTDDSSLFFNTSTVWGESQIFANTESMGKQGDIRNADMSGNKYNTPINRLRRLTNEIDVFATPFNRSLDFIMKGVISQLANIEVVPDYVFEDWGDRRTRFAELYPDVSSNTQGTANGASSGSGQSDSSSSMEVPNNDAFRTNMPNVNEDKYEPITGGDNGARNSDTPSVPRLNEGMTYLGDGMYVKIK
jgi:hypothetical protein